jgi:hypothetical protein
MKKHDVPLHVCKGCGKCSTKGKSWDDLVKEFVKHPDRFTEGVCAKPEVLDALKKDSADRER